MIKDFITQPLTFKPNWALTLRQKPPQKGFGTFSLRFFSTRLHFSHLHTEIHSECEKMGRSATTKDAQALLQSFRSAYAATPNNLKVPHDNLRLLTCLLIFLKLSCILFKLKWDRFIYLQIIDLYIVFAVATAVIQVRRVFKFNILTYNAFFILIWGSFLWLSNSLVFIRFRIWFVARLMQSWIHHSYGVSWIKSRFSSECIGIFECDDGFLCSINNWLDGFT